jgi:hypothetical protein
MLYYFCGQSLGLTCLRIAHGPDDIFAIKARCVGQGDSYLVSMHENGLSGWR